MNMDIQEIVRASASAIANGWWHSAILIGGVMGMLFLIERRRVIGASTRYAIRMVTLAAVVGVHALAFLASGDVPGRVDAMADADEVVPTPEHASPLPPSAAVTEVVVRAPEMPVLRSPSDGRENRVTSSVTSEPPASRKHGVAAWLISADSARKFAWLIAGLWLIGVMIGLARLVHGIYRVARMKRHGRPITSGSVVGLGRRARVLESHEVGSPVAAGYFRPAILIPAGLEATLDPDEFEQVLLHESGHIERLDDWTMLFQRLVEALFFHHPAVHWMGNAASRDREMACDEWVVERAGNPRSYAATLARLVQIRVTREHLVPGMPGSHLKERIRRLLAEASVMPRFRRDQVLSAAAIITLVATLMVWQIPGFQFQRWARARQAVPVPPVPPIEVPVAVEPPEPPVFPSVVPPVPPIDLEIPAMESVPEPVLDDVIPPVAPLVSVDPTWSRPIRSSAQAPAAVGVSDLSTASWISILNAAGGIPSSGDAARVLVLTADRMPGNEPVFLAYLAAAAKVSSSADRARVLMAIADRAASNDSVKAQYRRVADDLSRSDRNRVLRALGDS